MSFEAIRAAIAADLAALSQRVAAFNAAAPADLQVVGIDLDPGAPAAPVADGVVPGSMDEHGSVLLEGFERCIADSAKSADKWERQWAAQANIARRFMVPSLETAPGLTDQQRLSIRSNCAHAGTMWAHLGADVRDDAFDRKARCWPAYPITPNESGLGQMGANALPGVFAFCANSIKAHEARPEDGYQIAQSARRKWIQAQPAWVSETTGIVYGGQPKR